MELGTTPHLRVTCAVIHRGGKILATQRGPGMKHPLKWEFPGGKVEPGEREEDGIIREIKEELSISIRLTAQFEESTHDYGDVRITLVPFLANFLAGEIILHEHMSYRWLSPDDLSHLDWAEADLPVVTSVVAYFASSQTGSL